MLEVSNQLTNENRLNAHQLLVAVKEQFNEYSAHVEQLKKLDIDPNDTTISDDEKYDFSFSNNYVALLLTCHLGQICSTIKRRD